MRRNMSTNTISTWICGISCSTWEGIWALGVGRQSWCPSCSSDLGWSTHRHWSPGGVTITIKHWYSSSNNEQKFRQKIHQKLAINKHISILMDAFPTLKKSAFFSSNKKISVLLQLSKNQRSFPAFKKSAFFSNFQKIRVLFFLITYADFLSATSMM